MNIEDTLMGLVQGELPPWGWAIVLSSGFIGLLITSQISKKPKILSLGSGLFMGIAFFILKSFDL